MHVKHFMVCENECIASNMMHGLGWVSSTVCFMHTHCYQSKPPDRQSNFKTRHCRRRFRLHQSLGERVCLIANLLLSYLGSHIFSLDIWFCKLDRQIASTLFFFVFSFLEHSRHTIFTHFRLPFLLATLRRNSMHLWIWIVIQCGPGQMVVCMKVLYDLSRNRLVSQVERWRSQSNPIQVAGQWMSWRICISKAKIMLLEIILMLKLKHFRLFV